MAKPLKDHAAIERTVTSALADQPIIDMHTHLYPPTFGSAGGANPDPAGLMLWGVDELITYHYLVAEVYRVVPATELPYERFWAMSKAEQADHIWKHLFVGRSPISESCRGVLTTLQLLGLDTSDRSLVGFRKYFAQQDPSGYIDTVMEKSNVESITMTNAVFDDPERETWLTNPKAGDDPRFTGVLRFDPLLRDWPGAAGRLAEWGYAVGEDLSGETIEEGRRFLREWIDRVRTIYCAVSLGPEFRYPADGDDATARAGQKVLEQVVLPVCAERGLPFAMMIGAKRRELVNPGLGDAGDTVGKSDVQSVINLCREFPENRFFCTMLARENQHELTVAARKFGNLMVFGCWWFLNNPSLVEEMTRMRTELLGVSYIPQHSDARVLDQLIYKWDHSRRVIGKVLTDKYADLAGTGWAVSGEDVARDVRLLLRDNFATFVTG
ncbi:MAG: glucuronate isomerase [Planctomycetaceae bacterium]|nr:glucuronate isomerase [Planctomycetaceae bacterium]